MSFNHDFIYSIKEYFVPVDTRTKNIIKKIKLKKDNENYSSFSREEKINSNLIDIINEKIKPVYEKHGLTLLNCWVQLYKKDQYHSIHTHFFTQKDYSFVWFIDGDSNSAPLEFHDVGYPLINTGRSIKFNFKPGLFLIFPGFMPHEVHLNKSNNRLIVSGNLR